MSGGGNNTTISTSESAIDALRIQTSAYGYPIPILYGQNRITGNLIWYGDFQAIPHTTTQTSGGGGGKGGGGGSVTQSNTTYTYQTACAIALCEGPGLNMIDAWAGKDITTAAALGFSKFMGTYPQTAWGYLTSYHPGEALGYGGLMYLANGSYNLGDSASLPNHSFVVAGRLSFNHPTIVDAHPRVIVYDFLNNVNYGAAPGFPLDTCGQWIDYCTANGLFVSPIMNEQRPAHEHILEITSMTNAGIVYSEGLLKIIPYGDSVATGNGATFTPQITPEYDLTDDDFMNKSEPVKVRRKTQADAFNQVQIEFVNRANQYNVEIAEAKDQANIEQYGLRPMEVLKFHGITEAAVARKVAQLILQRALYIRNVYEFQLGWNYCRLEPMDIVTLTDGWLGMSKFQVRVTEVEEDEDGLLSFQAEEFPFGVAHQAHYPSQGVSGAAIGYNIAPGGINDPYIFEVPIELSASGGLEVWAAVSGVTANWGGCDVWASVDDVTYDKVGTISGGARHGVLQGAIGAGTDPDTTTTITVDLTASRGELFATTKDGADTDKTLSIIDGEFISYQYASLLDTNIYQLKSGASTKYTRRGLHRSTQTSHANNSKFARLDAAIFKHEFDYTLVGKPVYLKFQSFNIYGQAKAALADVLAITYTIKGDALLSPLANITNLVSYYRANQMLLAWDAVTDFRPVSYEVRKGTSWLTAQVLGTSILTEFQTDGDGTYWVSAKSGVAYSLAPVSIVVSGSVLTKNVVATFDEQGTGWAGTLSGLTNVSGSLETALGGTGTYTIPAGHIVDLGVAKSCSISANYTFSADNPSALISLVPLMSALSSVKGDYAGQATVSIQINLSQDGTTYAGWQDFIPGQYVGRKFNMRAVLTALNGGVVGVLSSFTFTVDMPDRIDGVKGLAVAAGGANVVYGVAFAGGPNGAAVPAAHITILNAQLGDYAVLTAETANGFTVQIMNGGAGVARVINWLSQGY